MKMKNKIKQKISITLDEETLKLIENSMKNQSFRNRSHAIEFSINKTLRSNGGEK